MSLYLVGENLDKVRGHALAGKGKLVSLMRGIYVDASDDIDAVVFKHAVRIAHYLYPSAFLSAASAFLLGPTREGSLFLSGRRKQRRRIGGLEIIQNQAPSHPSLGDAAVDDGMGEFRIRVSSIRQRFLEAFRLRSEHAASITEEMRAAMALRLIEEYGDAAKAADALWKLARENEWYREGEAAERYFLRRPIEPVRNEAAASFVVAWHGEPVGYLNFDGFEWRWKPAGAKVPPIVRQVVPGMLPPFILSLLPEGWLGRVLGEKNERTLLISGRRYLSNIAIVQREEELAPLPEDRLRARLHKHSKGGVFTGTYAGPGRDKLDENFERNLAQIYARADTPRLSGVQIKAPMHLDARGVLSPAAGKPFSHILKPAGSGGYEHLPTIEWVGMALGRAAGFVVPDCALVPMPDQMLPALVVERFDIRQGHRDDRLMALEDFCSILGLPIGAKYDSTMERVARALRPMSTAPDEDLRILFLRALFAWLIADGDMHLKNLSLLKIAHPGDRQFRAVRMAPLYDCVTTRAFPKLKHDHMALKLNGKDDNLRRSDFRTFAARIGLRASQAESDMDGLLKRLWHAGDDIELPRAVRAHGEASKMVEKMFRICQERVEMFT